MSTNMFEESDYMDMKGIPSPSPSPSIVVRPASTHEMDWKEDSYISPAHMTYDDDEDDYTDMRTTPLHSVSVSPSQNNVSRSVGNSPVVMIQSLPPSCQHSPQIGLERRLKMGGYAKNDDDDYDNLPTLLPNTIPNDQVYTMMNASPVKSEVPTHQAPHDDTYTVMTPRASPHTPRKLSPMSNKKSSIPMVNKDHVDEEDNIYTEMQPTPNKDRARLTARPPVFRGPLKSAPDETSTTVPIAKSVPFAPSESFRGRTSALSISRDMVDGVTTAKRAKTIKSNRAALAVQKYLELSDMERNMKHLNISLNRNQPPNKAVTMRNLYPTRNPGSAPATRSQHSLDRKYVEWLAKTTKHADTLSKKKKKNNKEVIDITEDFQDDSSPRELFDSSKKTPNKLRKMSFFHRSLYNNAASMKRKPRSKTEGNGNNNNADTRVRTPPSSPPSSSKKNKFSTLATSFRFMTRSDSKLNRYINPRDFSQSEGDASAFMPYNITISEDSGSNVTSYMESKKNSLRMSKTMSLERIFTGNRRRRIAGVDVCDSIGEEQCLSRKPSYGDSCDFFNYNVIRGFTQRRPKKAPIPLDKLSNRFGSVKRNSGRQRKRADSGGRAHRQHRRTTSDESTKEVKRFHANEEVPSSPTSFKSNPIHENALESLREEDMEAGTAEAAFDCEVMELKINKSKMSFLNAAKILFNRLHSNQPCTIEQPESQPSCVCKRPIPGKTLVNWLLQCIKSAYEDGTSGHGTSRSTVIGMWQVLVEKGYLEYVYPYEDFKDESGCYMFSRDVYHDYTNTSTSKETDTLTSKKLQEVAALEQLKKESGDALFRVVLRKPPKDRSVEDLQRIYEEVVDLKALTDLNDTIKRELARVAQIELFQAADTIVFRQGDQGFCWYVVLKGTFDVLVDGKCVCSYQEGEEFGRLALVNDTARAATVISREEDGQLIRVDKEDFARILKDAEANTISLKENNETVLIFQKTSVAPKSTDCSAEAPTIVTAEGDKGYTISLGKPEKILEYIVRNTPVWIPTDQDIEDFILTYPTFMTTKDLCKSLLALYNRKSEEEAEEVFETSMKRKVVYFVVRWSHIHTEYFCHQMIDSSFLQELEDAITVDIEADERYKQLADDVKEIWQGKTANVSTDITDQKPLTKFDQLPLEIHMSETASMIIKTPLNLAVPEVIQLAARKLRINQTDGLAFFEWKEDGDLSALPENLTSIATALGINSRLYLGQQSADDAFNSARSPFTRYSEMHEEELLDFIDINSSELAYAITEYDVILLNKTHPLEFIYKVFGPCKFDETTSNHNLLSRRFDQLAYWVPSLICSCDNINLRASLLRKFIKIALVLKKHQNLNAFLALVIGICNQSVVRMRNTWNKVPVKYRNIIQDAEQLLDPSRNHRAYRNHEATLVGARIPYFPLLMKDMTFHHEGNASWKNGMLDFEKMHKLADSIVKIVQVRIQDLGFDLDFHEEEKARRHVKRMKVITDQKLLNRKSNQLEPRT